MKKKRERSVWQLFSKTMIPQEVLPGNICLNMTGQRELILENYKGLLEYTSETLILITTKCKIKITGKNLKICYYAREEMKVTGYIQQVSYLPAGKCGT